MRKTVSVCVALLLWPLVAFAASDGSLGPTSTGSVSISIEFPTTIRISKIKDIVFGTWNATSGTITKNDNVCVFTSNPTGQYRVTLSGSGAGGAFTLTDGGDNTLPYRAFWADTLNNADLAEVFTGVTLTGQTGACTDSTNCSTCGNNTAKFRLRVYDDDMLTVHSGTYTGTLTFTVEPE